MKYNVFDVVELNSGSKAIIKKIGKGCYLVEIVNKDSTIRNISEDEISKLIWAKEK